MTVELKEEMIEIIYNGAYIRISAKKLWEILSNHCATNSYCLNASEKAATHRDAI